METETMGRVIVEATIENLGDLILVQRGLLSPERVRQVTIPDALVDTGATLISLPSSLIRQLGLTKKFRKTFRSATGIAEADVYGIVRLVVQGRECPTDVTELPDGTPVLIGQLPLEYMDWVVDLKGQRLIGNPDHGGEQMFDLF